MSSRRASALLATALLVVAGCGGSPEEPAGPLTKAELVAEADGVCGDLAAWYADHPFPVEDFVAAEAGERELAEVGDYLAAAPVDVAAEELAQLDAPDDAAEAWQELASRVETLAQTIDQQAEAGTAGDAEKFVGLAQTTSFQGSVIGQDVDRFGFDAATEGGCAQVF